MRQVSETDEESNRRMNPAIHYRFKRRIGTLNCHIQIYLMNKKLKIVINCIEDYSQDYTEYSNSFSYNQLQHLNKYFLSFHKINEILDDMANIFQTNSYDIEKNSNSLTLILHIVINDEYGDVHLTLFRDKLVNSKTSRYLQSSKNTDDRKKLLYKQKKDIISTDNSNTGFFANPVGVRSVRELNNLLTDLKDRITVLEVNQNTSPSKNKHRSALTYPEKNYFAGNSSLMGKEKVLLNMESILKRINRLEEANSKKKEKIKYLENKLKAYEASETDSFSENHYANNVDFISLGEIKKRNNINSNNRNNNLREIEEEVSSSDDRTPPIRKNNNFNNYNPLNKDNNGDEDSDDNYNYNYRFSVERKAVTRRNKKANKMKDSKQRHKSMDYEYNKDNNLDDEDDTTTDDFNIIKKKKKTSERNKTIDKERVIRHKNEEIINTNLPKKNKKKRNKSLENTMKMIV